MQPARRATSELTDKLNKQLAAYVIAASAAATTQIAAAEKK
jgi:hypothetical protein